MSWIRYQLGPEAMERYFSTNRPVWGGLYQITTRLIPQIPLYWQVFGLFWRWAAGVLVWAILCELFPKQARLATFSALLFLLYPGFNQQWGAYLYSHFFIVLNFFLISIYLMLRAQKEHYWLWTSLAMLFSALNLWMHEYFFTLEAARIAIVWIMLRNQNLPNQLHPQQAFFSKTWTGFKLWAPYLVVFLAAVLYRLFIFNNQIYEIGGEQAGQSALDLVTTILIDVWNVTVTAWSQVFQIPTPGVDGLRVTFTYAIATLGTAGLAGFALFKRPELTSQKRTNPDAPWIIGLGAFMVFVAGWPFWLTGVPISLAYPANRATLSFMLGACIFIGGLLTLLPRRISVTLLTVLVAFAAGRQFLWSNEFRRDWNAQKNLFWQMTWRAPGLTPGSIVLINEELKYYADNSLGATLNWIFAPENHTERVDYALFYPTNRLDGALAGLEPGLEVEYDYLAGQFIGTTSQVIAFYYAPPGCLRVLDPQIDPYNRLIPAESLLREAALLSTAALITPEKVAYMPAIYEPEPAHDWCYFFEQADLARQIQDWKRVTELGDQAFALNDYPNDPLERFVFIEGYAHNGEWEKALALSQDSYQVSKTVVGPLLCRLWERIEIETPASIEKLEYSQEAKLIFLCNQ